MRTARMHPSPPAYELLDDLPPLGRGGGSGGCVVVAQEVGTGHRVACKRIPLRCVPAQEVAREVLVMKCLAGAAGFRSASRPSSGCTTRCGCSWSWPRGAPCWNSSCATAACRSPRRPPTWPGWPAPSGTCTGLGLCTGTSRSRTSSWSPTARAGSSTLAWRARGPRTTPPCRGPRVGELRAARGVCRPVGLRRPRRGHLGPRRVPLRHAHGQLPFTSTRRENATYRALRERCEQGVGFLEAMASVYRAPVLPAARGGAPAGGDAGGQPRRAAQHGRRVPPRLGRGPRTPVTATRGDEGEGRGGQQGSGLMRTVLCIVRPGTGCVPYSVCNGCSLGPPRRSSTVPDTWQRC